MSRKNDSFGNHKTVMLSRGLPQVTVRVGKEKPEEFKVPKNILCPGSPFFSNALNGPWKESQEQVISFPEYEPWVFRAYQEFIYTKVFSDWKTWPDVNTASCTKLLEIYYFGYYVQDTDLKDAAVDFLSRVRGLKVSLAKDVRMIYENTTPSSKLRLLCIDQFMHLNTGKTRLENFNDNVEELPKDFLADMIRENFEPEDGRMRPLRREIFSSCRYHEHVLERRPCYKGKKFPRK